jgi:hypothetical protein
MIHEDLIRALDPVEFSRYIGIEPDEWQADVLRYEGKRLLLNCSRQSGKSTTTAIKALHTGVYRPKSLILLVSPSLRQTQELFRKVKEGYERMETRPRLIEDNRLSVVLSNGSRIVSLPSDQSTVRGFSGVTMILEDEASQVKDEFYYAILPMLIVNNGTLICMTTPYGKRGHFFKEWTGGGDIWKRIEIPATKCPRISAEELERQRRSLGSMFFRQEFLCEFVETTDQVFGYDMVQNAFDNSIKPLFGM